MKTFIFATALFFALSSLVSAKEVYPMVGDGASGQYNTKMDPSMGDGSLMNQTRALPADTIFVGESGVGGSAYLLAFETTPDIRTKGSQGKLRLELPLVGKSGNGVKVKVILLGGSKPLSENKWARYRAWNVAGGYTVLGEIPVSAEAQTFHFDINWAEKGIWENAPIAWFAVFTEEGNLMGKDSKMIFAGEGEKMPKLVTVD